MQIAHKSMPSFYQMRIQETFLAKKPESHRVGFQARFSVQSIQLYTSLCENSRR